jgi:hypothetical protein
MHAHTDRPRYAPASVGVLVDPEFLRGAAQDANGDRRAESTFRPGMRLRWKATVDAIVVAIRRR